MAIFTSYADLVGGLKHGFYMFQYIGNNPSQLTSIFFRGIETTNQLSVYT